MTFFLAKTAILCEKQHMKMIFALSSTTTTTALAAGGFGMAG